MTTEIISALLGTIADLSDAARIATESCKTPPLTLLLNETEGRLRVWAGSIGILRRAVLSPAHRHQLVVALNEAIVQLHDTRRLLEESDEPVLYLPQS